MGGGHIVSPLSVCPSVCPVCNTFGFRAISFEGLVYWIEIYTQIYNHKMWAKFDLG